MSKTITIDDQAYETLSSLKEGKGDSFSQVIHRNLWRKAKTCGELLEMMENEPPPKVNPALLKRVAVDRGRRSGGRR